MPVLCREHLGPLHAVHVQRVHVVEEDVAAGPAAQHVHGAPDRRGGVHGSCRGPHARLSGRAPPQRRACTAVLHAIRHVELRVTPLTWRSLWSPGSSAAVRFACLPVTPVSQGRVVFPWVGFSRLPFAVPYVQAVRLV
jgi:hypothetical protein